MSRELCLYWNSNRAIDSAVHIAWRKIASVERESFASSAGSEWAVTTASGQTGMRLGVLFRELQRLGLC